MVYCLNPDCSKPDNPNKNTICHGCQEDLDKSSQEYLFRLHYRIIKQLGEGGIGRIYLAEDTDYMNEKRVIKKFIYPVEHPQFEKAKDLFKQEAQYLYELIHPQIPRLYAYFEHNHAFYLVQEFIEGKNLDNEVWEEGTFDEIKLRQLLKELLSILVYLHDSNIVHGDIKPENIMRRSCAKKSQENKQSELVLIDFGSCIKFDDHQKIIGSFGSYTRGYAAIEHIQNQPVFASDIHCLGMTAVRLLTRCFREDFENNKFNDWLYVDGELKWREYGEERGNKVSDQLAYLLNKMLEPLVEHRYQSAQEVLDDLQKIIETVEPVASENNTENVSKRPPCNPTFVPPSVPPRRNRKKRKKRNQKLIEQIAIIGPRPSGKYTYLASFAYFINMVKNSPIKCIISNSSTKNLIRETQDVLMKQNTFKAMRADMSIFDYPYYYFSLTIKNTLSLNPFKNTKIKSQGEFNCSCLPLPGEFFDAVANKLPEDRYTERTLDFIKYFTVNHKSIILLADSNLPEKDENIANTLNNIQPYILPEHQQRIALVFSMFETPKLQQYRNDIENFAEMFFPRTVNALDDLIEYKNCDVAYFACSAFGFLEEDGQLVPNVRYMGRGSLSHFGVIKDPKRWKPFGVVAPIYWLLTGEHDKRLLNI